MMTTEVEVRSQLNHRTRLASHLSSVETLCCSRTLVFLQCNVMKISVSHNISKGGTMSVNSRKCERGDLFSRNSRRNKFFFCLREKLTDFMLEHVGN